MDITDIDNHSDTTNKVQDPTGGYQICVHIGTAPAALIDAGIRCVEMVVAESNPDGIIAALEATALQASDFRAQALFSIGADVARDTAVMAYAALLGFSGKRPDVVVGDVIVNASDLDALARDIADAGQPEDTMYQVQVGSVTHPVLHSVIFSSSITTTDATAVRFARRLRFAPAADAAQALTQLIVVAGMRAKGSLDRLPYLVDGDEPFDPSEPIHLVGVCLDTIKNQANAVRRSRHGGNRTCIIDAEADTSRLVKLRTAADAPIEAAMVWLGARMNEDSGLWHCPRPERHTNGDANASMRVTKGRTRCFRCDGERVDALRLVMDSKHLAPDDAAAWIVTQAAAHDVELADPGIEPVEEIAATCADENADA